MAVRRTDSMGKGPAVRFSTGDVSAIAQRQGEVPQAEPGKAAVTAVPSSSNALIRPGTMVVSWDMQQIGPVRTIVYDAASGLPARLVVQLQGDAASTVTLPVRCIERILGGEVYLNLSLEQLPRA
jgi:hypothetical protein